MVGYVVGVMPSFMQVAAVGGRLVLRDGYHRAVGLLTNGISVVPAFVRDFPSVEGIGGPGLFQASVFLGPQPPVLVDYLDDAVSATWTRPAFQTVIIVQATAIAA